MRRANQIVRQRGRGVLKFVAKKIRRFARDGEKIGFARRAIMHARRRHQLPEIIHLKIVRDCENGATFVSPAR